MSWLKHTYASKLPKSLYSVQSAIPVSDPEVVLYNEVLAKELGVSEYLTDLTQAAQYLSGNEKVPNSFSISQAYAGHQFGHFNKLGDGRAVLLGEIETDQGLVDLQLKGSGQTPYSRRGDGRATFYSMLREYLISEAMHALGIPTSRSLAVVKTSDPVYREQVNDGAILSRIASSHIRVGTFEYARYFGQETDLQTLLDYTISRHYPELLDHENQALALLEKVMHKQTELIIHWFRVGFIHGVMNTDNVSISGETIDYGPCAFMNVYHPKTVFSSIDREGRYAFGNQANITYWNLSVFANALLPLIDEDEEVAKAKGKVVLDQYPEIFSSAYFKMMADKLGIVNYQESDQRLIKDCLVLLMKLEVDYSNFFTELRRGGELITLLKQDETFNSWYLKWEEARLRGSSVAESIQLMIQNNPIIIPRNHIVEEVLLSAVSGNMQAFHDLLDKLGSPYDDSLGMQEVPAEFDASYQTFCGT